MTVITTFEQLVVEYHKNVPNRGDQRRGQYFYNLLNTHRPTVAREMTFTACDPFYVDANLPAAFPFVGNYYNVSLHPHLAPERWFAQFRSKLVQDTTPFNTEDGRLIFENGVELRENPLDGSSSGVTATLTDVVLREITREMLEDLPRTEYKA